jgi:hypothetical protein
LKTRFKLRTTCLDTIINYSCSESLYSDIMINYHGMNCIIYQPNKKKKKENKKQIRRVIILIEDLPLGKEISVTFLFDK